MSRLDTLGRELMDLREDYETKRKSKVRAEDAKNAKERELFDEMKAQNSKTTVLELGPGYGDVQVGRRETIRARVIDLDAALDAFEQSAQIDEISKTEIRKKQLNEIVRERLLTGQPLPAGIDFTRTPYIEVTRRKS